MKRSHVLLILVALFAASAFASHDPTVAEVEQGTMEDSLAVFKGVPFAKPSVGDLRWAALQSTSNLSR